MTNLMRAIAERAHSHAGSVALSDANKVVRYGELGRLVDSTAAQIAALCPGRGPVAIAADNSIGWVAIDLACIKLERTLIPLPPFFTEEQRRHALEQSGATALIVETADRASRRAGTFEVLNERFEVRPLDAVAVVLPAGTAKITYTSGTTGRAKGVCLSQAALERVSESLVQAIGSEYAGTHFAVLPLGVLLENIAGLYTTLLAGGRYHVLRQAAIGFANPFMPDFAALTAAIGDCGATSVILVPELLRGLVRTLAVSAKSLPKLNLVAVGGARVAPSLLQDAARVGLPVYQGYGLSEAASVTTLNTPAHNRPGSVGKALNHTALSIDADGEIVLKDAGFLGYAGGEAAPSVYRTGDVGHLDADGFLYIDGRKSNVLITSFGRNVSPEWVESELLAQAQIAQAFVCGEAKPALGALVVPSSLQVTDADLAAAINRANAALPAYAQIKHWSKVFPFLPANGLATPNGRLKRDAIGAHYARQIQRMFDAPGQHTTFFERLIAETLQERGYLMQSQQIKDGLAGRISLETYRQYLGEAYHHVRHTVPLLMRVRDTLPPEKAWLRKAAEEYIDEESGHEEWILNDIKNAGGNSEAVRHGAPRPSTELMVAYAYDFVNRINPVGFFGMVFVLEGTSTQLATTGANALMRTLKLTPNCFTYLTSHGALDISHMQFFQSLMDRIDDPRDQADIIHMAKRMFVLFADVFRSIPHDMAVQNVA